MSFFNLYRHGFARVAAVSLPVSLANPSINADRIIAKMADLNQDGVAAAVFPRMCLTGFSIGDLQHSQVVLNEVEQAISRIAKASRGLVAVGAPVRFQGHTLDSVVVAGGGELLGVVIDGSEAGTITIGESEVDLDSELVFCPTGLPAIRIGVSVGEMTLGPRPADVNVWLSASAVPAQIGGRQAQADRVRAWSSFGPVAVVEASAGAGESSNDAAWAGTGVIAEAGRVLTQTAAFSAATATADIFLDNLAASGECGVEVPYDWAAPNGDLGLRREVPRFPFIATETAAAEAFAIMAAALEQRLTAIGQPKIVLGVSGGLDSTLALLTAVATLDRLNRPRTDLLAFTMPGFATGATSKGHATRLAEGLGVSFEVLDITEVASLMLRNIGHKPDVFDVTFENVQAGLRTDYLFRLANQRGGIVLGTGDLSEAALGWCTYGVGDHMSHFNVNAGMPKTLIQHTIRWLADQDEFAPVKDVLLAILGTEISPELIPGAELQSTQNSVGPYALQDFTLYHAVQHGLTPSQIAFLAFHAWRDAFVGDWPDGLERRAFTLAEIKHWLMVFTDRFYRASQFKRSASANGPQVVSVSLSPRGGWAAPSDCRADVWLAEVANIPDGDV